MSLDKDSAADDSESDEDVANYAYLLDTTIRQFSSGDSSELYKRRDEKRSQLEKMTRSTVEDLWLSDLDELEADYAKWLDGLKKLRKEAKDARTKTQKSESKARSKSNKQLSGDVEPSNDYQDIEPPLDEYKKKSNNAENKKLKKANGIPEKKKKKSALDSSDEEETVLYLDDSDTDIDEISVPQKRKRWENFVFRAQKHARKLREYVTK